MLGEQHTYMAGAASGACERATATATGEEDRATPVPWMGVGHLDTLHLPGYAVGPFLVTNSDE